MAWMKDEILSEPIVLKNTISNNLETVKRIAELVKQRNITSIATVSRGSSSNAVTCFKYFSEILSGYSVLEIHPSVITMYGAKPDFSKHLMIAVSQSGQSTDTLEVMKCANDSGAVTVAVTNDENSPLAKCAQFHLHLSCEQEHSVAATKTMAAEVLVLGLLVLGLADKFDQVATLEKIPDKLAELASRYDEIKDLARKISHQRNVIILTRGPMQGIGREVALKYKECCYVMSHFYSVSDFMHGPLAIVEEGSSVLMLAPSDECLHDYIEMATRLNLLVATVTAITDTNEVSCAASYSFVMPERADMITDAVLYAFVGHILCYEIAFDKGLNPDVPRNLKKVTVTK